MVQHVAHQVTAQTAVTMALLIGVHCATLLIRRMDGVCHGVMAIALIQDML